MKKLNQIIPLLAMIMVSSMAMAQDISGRVFGFSASEGAYPLTGVNVYWSGTTHGVVTGIDGSFVISPHNNTSHNLVFSFVGYANDTMIAGPGTVFDRIIMQIPRTLSSFTVTERAKSTNLSRIDPLKTTEITQGEIRKAACCNLSESFETNPSVDVSYSDAVTGARMIQLLGLSGSYVQTMFENMPDYQGLHSPYALTFVPGPWLSSIYVSKGASSVISGYQSITGQINAEFKKPDDKEWLYLNLFGNSNGRFEFNANVSAPVGKKMSTMLLAHASYNDMAIDKNDDHFLDIPFISRYHLFNRWKYKSENLVFQFGGGIVSEERTGGQAAELFDEMPSAGLYQTFISNRRSQFFVKGGYLFPGKVGNSIAFLANASQGESSLSAGNKTYTGKQLSVSSRIVYQGTTADGKNSIQAGFSDFYDEYDEEFNDSIFARIEHVPGLFAEYTLKSDEAFTLMMGLRYDHHNRYGGFVTPRLHVRYSPFTELVFRASAGTGRRSPNLFADYNGIMASSRRIVVDEDPQMEVAANLGLNATYYGKLLQRDYTLSAEFYRTSFENQLVVDMDSDPYAIYVGNLHGKSYSNSFQIEFSYEPVKRFEMLLAFRRTDVKQSQMMGVVDKPFVKQYKALATASYQTRLNKWQFDATVQVNGPSRLPELEGWPVQYTLDENSPVFTMLSMQVTKNFRHWNIYGGVENLLDFTQAQPILGADDPFGMWFDATRVWGPIDGRRFYLGIRMSLDRKEKPAANPMPM